MKFSHSTRLRIQLWHGLMLTLVTVALLSSFWNSRRMERMAEFDSRLQDRLLLALPLLAQKLSSTLPPGVQPLSSELEFGSDTDMRRARDLYRRLESLSFHYGVWNEEGGVLLISDNAKDLPPPEVKLKRNESLFRTRGNLREIMHNVDGDELVVLGNSLDEVNLALYRLALRLIFMGLAIIGTVLIVGWWLTSRALQPVKAISRTAAKIADGDLSQRINVSRMDTETELGELAVDLNHTFSQLQQNMEQQVRFTADASHELRTPLTVILTKTQVALARERSAEDYRTALQACERAGLRMKELVNALLELSRLDKGERQLDLKPNNLSEIAKEAFEDIRILAEKHTLELQGAEQPLPIMADAARLHQVVTNLLANAVKHTPVGSKVYLRLEQQQATDAVLQVIDNGPGIPPDALPHLFERFYRVDKARARSEGGTGLGLAISRSLVQAHYGSLTAESVLGKGSIFSVKIPLATSMA
jgi:two-component system, OmpR family, sensor kinase